jgi:hypothetical protein
MHLFMHKFLFYKYNTTTVIGNWNWIVNRSWGLKSFMLKNCKVDFVGNSEVAFFFIRPVYIKARDWLITYSSYWDQWLTDDITPVLSHVYYRGQSKHTFSLFFQLYFLKYCTVLHGTSLKHQVLSRCDETTGNHRQGEERPVTVRML